MFEKNNVTYNTTTTGAAYPFIGISSTNFSNCTVRNNLVTVNATAANQVRGMLIGIAPSLSPFPSVRNCLILNNDMIYNGTGGTTSNVGATVNVYSVTGNDSIVNCTIANNKSTNVSIAGLSTPNNVNTINITQNNVLWNNTYGASTVANISVNSTTSASSSITKNFTNGGQTVTENGTTITGNNFTLSSTNDTGTNQPLFKSPVINTKVGSSLSTLNATDSTTIKQSNWKLQSSSYLINKGIYLPNSPTAVSPLDKDGKYFATSPTLPAIGAYEYKTSPNLQWSAQSDLTLTTASSAQTLSAATSDISTGSSPAGTNIVYSSDNPGVVTVSGTTLTVVGVGTTTIRAQQVGTNYETVSVTKNVTVTIPLVITGITPYNGQLSVAFTNADPTGVTNYKYSTNGGSTWTSSGQTTSPILIKGLTNGTSYNVQIRSYTTGDGLATPTTAATPNVATYLVQQGSGSSWSGTVLSGRNVVNLSTVNGGSAKSFNEWFADKSLASPTFAGAAFGTGDQVWIINGTYYLSGTVTLKDGVAIYGGFAGTEIPAARAKNSADLWDFTNVTALDGSVSGTKTYIGISSASIPTVTIVNGLTIQNCTNGTTSSSGGGAKIYGSGVSMQNCIVTACTATGSVATAASAGVSVLSGTLKDSYIHHNTSSSSGTCAGGIAVYSDGGTVSGCKIEYNSVTGAGGGIYLYSSTSGVSITNCSFSNNSATSNGGAIASYINNTTNSSAISITGCSFTSNSSSANGGAMSLAFSGTYTNNSFNVSGCTFTSNYSTTASGNSSNGGGAICFSGVCAYSVDKCTFTGNYTTLAYGGALQITSTSSGTISNSKFNNNTAGSTTTNNGSAIYCKSSYIANNCLFADNTGINPIAFNGSSAASTFQNCTFANNLTSAAAATPIPLVALTPAYAFSNCLFYKVSGFSGQTPTLTNCAFDIAVPTGATNSQTGVSTADFIDATNATIASRNYNLATGSRAIDAGTTITACSPDIANTVRPQGNAYDLGAYEYSGTNLSFATKTSMSKTYGNAAFTNAATGLPSGGAISYTSGNTAVATVNANSGQVTIIAAGTAIISATIAANGSNGAATASYTLTVAKKTLTITAQNQTVSYGTGLSSVTDAGTYAATGFITGEDATVIGGTISYSTTYTNTTAAGTAGVTITPIVSSLTATNYSFTAVAGTVSITKATPSISVSGAQSYTYDGSAQGPATTSYNGDGTPSLLYTSTDGGGYSAATVPTNAGTYQVVYSATTGTNYNAASTSAYTFTIYSTGNISSDTNVSSLTLSVASNLSVAAGNTLTIDAATTVNSVTVAPGAKLTLNAGKTMNTGSITLQSDASGTATLTDGNSNGGLTVSGTSSVQQYLSGARNWYVSSPVAGSAVPASGYTFYSRNEPAANWTTMTSDSILKAGRGYIANLLSGTGTYNFSGTINSGDKNVSLFFSNGVSKAGFNLIGNPYPSHYSVSKSQTDAANALNTIWYRTADWVVDNVTPSNSKYVYTFQTCLMQPNGSIIGTPDGTSNIIPPMQAFWVRTSVNGSTFSFANANRSHQTSNMFKSAAKKDQNQPMIRLQTSNGMVNDEAVIYSNADATDGFDAYDAIKMNNNSASVPEIYTVVDNQQIAINGMNSIPYNTEMPLGFTTLSAGNFSIKASLIANLVTGAQVILKDYQDTNNPVITDLSDGNSYLFSSSVITNNSSRFALIFKAPSVTTGINPAESGDVWISTRNGQIMINGVNGNGARLEVYNAVGQKLFSGNLTGSNTPLNTKFAAGTYLVKLSSNGYSVTKKLIID